MYGIYEQMTTLQYRYHCLLQQLEAFKSGEKYRKMDEEYKKLPRFHNKEIKRLEYELSKAHSETVTVRKYRSQVMDDLEKEHRKEVERLLAEIRYLKKENRKLTVQRDEAKDKYRERNREYYAVAAELLEEKGKNKKLTAQVNRDFETSSIPSSLQKAGRKKIPNSREKTGRKPGGQTGHTGHCRKKHAVTESHEIPVPEKYTECPDYHETGKVIRKQKVAVKMSVTVTEYFTKSESDDLDEEKVGKYEERYDAILAIAEKEYSDNPPGDYYREGYNLFLRLRK